MSPSTAPDSTVSQGSASSEWSQEMMGLSMQEQHLWEILYKEVVTHGQAQHHG